MILNHQKLLSELKRSLADHEFWSVALDRRNGSESIGLHLAIFREPYLTFVMEGKKTIETRFARRACPPYGKVSEGDVLGLKKAACAVVGVCMVKQVWFYQLDPKSLKVIRDKFGPAICPVDDSFWEERRECAYATLMLVDRVTPIQNLAIKKRDRRGWVVFDNTGQCSLL